MTAIIRRLSWRVCLALCVVFAAVSVHAQTSTDTNSAPDQIAALQLELTNAWHQVQTIVCKPPPAFRYNPSYSVSIYSPGWFHAGASIPDFNNVDVRKSQELTYTSPWVSSDVTPNMMFRGSDLEFNANTKLFYTNRSLPKRKLSEAEMLQINSLYRTIGKCQSDIWKLQPHPAVTETTAAGGDDTQDGDTNDATPPKIIAAIARIPQQTRIRYGGIAIGALVVGVIALRLLGKKKSD